MRSLLLLLLTVVCFASCRKKRNQDIPWPGTGKVKTAATFYSNGDSSTTLLSYDNTGKLYQKKSLYNHDTLLIETYRYAGSTLTQRISHPASPGRADDIYSYQLNVQGYASSRMSSTYPDIQEFYSYNTRGQLTEVRRVYIAPAGNDTRTYRYYYFAADCDSIVITQTWTPGERYVYKYDYYPNRKDTRNYFFNEYTDHLGAPSAIRPLKAVTAITYNAAGNITLDYTEAYTYEYDNSGRITKEMYSSNAARPSTTYYEYY